MKASPLIRTSLLLLLLLAVAAMAFGCGRPEPLPVTDENGNFAYRVIRPDVAGNDVFQASVDVKQSMQAVYGVEPVIGTDWIHPSTGKADYPEIATEVLVGKTNRAESLEVWESLGDYEYTVRIVNQKIVILGKTDFGTKLAANYFINTYMSGKYAGEIPLETTITMEADHMYTYTLTGSGAAKYDDSITIATLQGLYNRTAEHKLYITTGEIQASSDVLSLLSAEGRHLADVEKVKLAKRDDVFQLAASCIESVAIWDLNVPATINVATTIAGVENGIVMTFTGMRLFHH